MNGGRRDAEWNRIKKEYIDNNSFVDQLAALNAGFQNPVVDIETIDAPWN